MLPRLTSAFYVQALIRLADRHYIIEKGRTVWTGSDSGTNRA